MAFPDEPLPSGALDGHAMGSKSHPNRAQSFDGDGGIKKMRNVVIFRPRWRRNSLKVVVLG